MHDRQLIKSTSINSDDNYYATLDLPRTATPDEIKTSYMRLTRIYHPDKNNNNQVATEIFIKIKKAYETLSDPIKRAHYDRMGNGNNQEQDLHYLTFLNRFPSQLEHESRCSSSFFRMNDSSKYYYPKQDLSDSLSKIEQLIKSLSKSKLC